MSMSRKAGLLSCAGLATLIVAGPALAQGPSAEPAATGDSTVGELVVSIRRAEQRAVDAKRKADNQIDALYANDVGKLPDQNVAEAVRRMPGVSVANDQGEGRYVILRGVNPNLANVTVNGASAAVPEPEGRQIKLDDIPSALIGRVEVIKSLTPDLDANAIAGQLDIATVSAFDRDRPFVSARAALGQYDINGAHPYEADLTAGGRFGPDQSFGVVIGGNVSRRPIESQNFGASGPSFGTVRAGPAPGTTISTNFPSLWEVRDYNLVRQREGVTANFDWRPSDGMKLYLRTLYSTFSDNETRDRFRIDNEPALFNPGSTATTGSFNGRGIAYVRRRREDDNTRTALLGGEFALPLGKLTAEAGYSRAEKEDPLRSEVQFRTGGSAIAVTYDVSDPLYQFAPSTNFYAPATFTAFNSVNYDYRDAVNTLKQGRVDLVMPFASAGQDSSLKFGVKLQDLRKTNERNYQQYNGGAAPPTLAATAKPGIVNLYDGRYQLGPRIDYDAFQSYVTSTPTALVLNTSGSVANSLVNDYDASEKVYAAYGMATLHFGALTLIPGVRVEKTEGSYAAKSFTLASSPTQAFNVFGKFDYTDVFPGLNARYDMGDNLTLRGAVTTAIGRPNFADLAPYVSQDVGAATAAVGNPNLEPLKSVNADAAVEYYLPHHGVVSASVFYKDIDDPIFSTVRTLAAAEDFSGVSLPVGTQVTQPVNATSAKVKGVEVNIQTSFDFLPSPFDGLGVSANATFIDADAEGVPGRAGKAPLALQSDEVGTVQIYYEKAGFQGRVAWSYRSPYLLALGGSAASDQYVASYAQIDARVSYTFSKATVFIEGANLTDEPYTIYQGARSQVIENERYGATWRTGLQLAF